MIKQILKLSQGTALLMSAILETILIDTEGNENVEMRAQTITYNHKMQTKAITVENSGPPHIWAMGGLLKALVARGQELGRANFEELKRQNDDYQGIMMEAIADRLAEAFAELVHHKMRTEIWGYAPDEKLSPDDMLKTKYQGIRPAPGYPTQPDHTEKNFMWELLKADKNADITLTDSLAMLPAASVSALVFANECSTYFQVGKVCKDQIVDYASRKGMSVEAAEKWMGPYLGYDNMA